jgi:hypothetical protein
VTKYNVISHSMNKVVPPLIIFLLAFTVYWLAPSLQLKDSKYTMVLSQALLSKGTFKLDSLFVAAPIANLQPGDLPPEIMLKKGHLFYTYPPGSSVLSVPFLAVINWFGYFPVDPAGKWIYDAEACMQQLIAEIVSAAFVAMVFMMARLWLPSAYSCGVALVLAFGTQLLSTASRALWSHTWGILLILTAILLLIKNETENKTNPYLLATILSWAYFVRPTFNMHIIAISVYLVFQNRKQFIPYSITGLLWLALFIGYSWYNLGTLLPPYYTMKLGSVNYWEAFAGQLVSPSRGLFIYSPFWLLLFYLLVRYWKFVKVPKLAILSLAVVGIHFMVVPGCLSTWSGGHCYGPRMTTDLLPWLALLATLGVNAVRLAWLQDAGTDRSLFSLDHSKKAVLIIALITISFSIFTHYRGAFHPITFSWNNSLSADDATSGILWNWRDPQFLRGF